MSSLIHRSITCLVLAGGIFTTLSASADSGPALESQSSRLQSSERTGTEVLEHELSRAAQWGLEDAEWQRYRTLMQGIRASVSPATLSPIEVLGIHARVRAVRLGGAGGRSGASGPSALGRRPGKLLRVSLCQESFPAVVPVRLGTVPGVARQRAPVLDTPAIRAGVCLGSQDHGQHLQEVSVAPAGNRFAGLVFTGFPVMPREQTVSWECSSVASAHYPGDSNSPSSVCTTLRSSCR